MNLNGDGEGWEVGRRGWGGVVEEREKKTQRDRNVAMTTQLEKTISNYEEGGGGIRKKTRMSH